MNIQIEHRNGQRWNKCDVNMFLLEMIYSCPEREVASRSMSHSEFIFHIRDEEVAEIFPSSTRLKSVLMDSNLFIFVEHLMQVARSLTCNLINCLKKIHSALHYDSVDSFIQVFQKAGKEHFSNIVFDYFCFYLVKQKNIFRTLFFLLGF